jgi:hypothetical protein
MILADLRIICGLWLLAGVSATAAAQSKTQVIRGRIASDSGTVVRGADVIVTVAPTAEVVATTSDSVGAYRVLLVNPTGEYLLSVSALGRKPIRRRVSIAPGDSIAVVNVTLQTAVAQIAAVRVQARKVRPSPSLGRDALGGTDATDRTFDGVSGALSPNEQGNFDAMAAFVPGLTTTAGGMSAFGMSADNNTATLNGLAFAGGGVPRDAQTTTRFRTSPWDPTVGGFAGVQVASQLSAGGNITRRRGHVTLDAPTLQLTDHIANQSGQRYTNLAVDEGGIGALRLDKYFYNFGLHLARRMANVASLADLDARALAASGVSADSAARLMQILGSVGVPPIGGNVPHSRTITSASYIERFDLAPSASPNGVPGATRALTLFGQYARSDAQTLRPTMLPSVGGRTTDFAAGAQALYARYFGHDGDYVNELTSGLSIQRRSGTPYTLLPAGSVLVASATGIGTLAFGGNSSLDSDAQTLTWETINQTDFLLRGKASLPMKFYVQSRVDGVSQSPPADRLGRFNFNSLNDLAIGRPATFERSLISATGSTAAWTGALAAGGDWVASPTLKLTGGIRLDANTFFTVPALNHDAQRLFGVRTDRPPRSIALSPRIGFNWRYTNGPGYRMLTSGEATVYRGASSLHGGVGRFRSLVPMSLVGDAASSTGLAGGDQRLVCIGDAVPVPAWADYAADPSTVPTMCAAGRANLADTSPNLIAFGPGFSPADSWRANLGWTTTSFLGAYVNIDATYSLNLHQPSVRDLNFAGAPEFGLANEANRPVFVGPANIVASTGVVSSAETRRFTSFGRVTERVSDLRGDARQLTVYAIPNISYLWGVATIAYTYTDARAQLRGFDAATAGDPRETEWARSSWVPRHQILAQYARFWFGGALTASTGIRVSSGFAFTPTVRGDINGDGWANDDRAFMFPPDEAPDASVAAGVTELMTSGSDAARDCLRRQVGRIAGRNSCVGPWYATMNGNLGLTSVPHMGNRMRAYLSFTNVLGALDQALHGGDNLHGWGTVPFPDPLLYSVRGFDAATHAFSYDVNPRFGSTDPSTTIQRNPFRVTIDVRFDLGRTIAEQQVEQTIRVRPSLYGTRASADTIKARYLRTQFTDIYAVLLRYGDSLALSRAQVERVQERQTILRAQADSIFGALAQYLATLPPSYSVKEASQHARAAQDAIWNVIAAEHEFLHETLMAGQIVRLPGGIREVALAPGYKGRFFY